MADNNNSIVPWTIHKLDVWKLYLFAAGRSLLFFVPVLVLFLEAQNLSRFHAFVLPAAFLFIHATAKRPAQYLLDKTAAKTGLIMSAYLLTLGMILYSIGETFAMFLTAQTIWTLGWVIGAEAETTLLKATLYALDMADTTDERLRFMDQLRTGATLLAMIAGGVLAGIAFRVPFYATTVTAAVLIPLAFTTRQPVHTENVYTASAAQLFTSVKALFTGTYRWLAVYAVFMTMVTVSAFWLYQLFFHNTVSLHVLGLLYGAAIVFMHWSGNRVSWFADRFGTDRVVIGTVLTAAAAFALLPRTGILLAVHLAILLQITRSMVQPVTDRYWEQDEEVVKTAMLLGAAVALPVTGWAAGMYPVETVFTGFAVLTFIGGGTILFLLCRTDIL